MTKKILFISYDGMTDPLGQSQVIPYLQGLSKNGYQIFLLSCEKKGVFNQNKKAVEFLLQGYNISWIPLRYTKNPPVLSTLWDVMQLRKAAKKIHEQHKIDMVHTRPGIPALVGLWMKQTMGIKFLHDVREFYADSRVDGGIWKISNPVFKLIYNYFKRKEALQIEKSDGIVCLTYAAENIIRQSSNYNSNIPLQVIPCSADLELFNPSAVSAADKNRLRQELKINDNDLIISYLGSIGGWYLTKEMLLFCKQLSDKIPAAKFLFISPHLHDVIIKEAGKYGLSADKLLVRKAKRQEVPALLSLSSYSIFFIKPCYSKLSSSPTKHGELMAMGIPVIANSGVGDVKEIIEQYNAGFVLNDFNEGTFTDVIAAIEAGTPFNKTSIREGAANYYSLETAIKKYTTIYTSILG